jgi:hypothetical protein
MGRALLNRICSDRSSRANRAADTTLRALQTMSAKEHTTERLMFADEYAVKTIELLPCKYRITCRARNCKHNATIFIGKEAAHREELARLAYLAGARDIDQFDVA